MAVDAVRLSDPVDDPIVHSDGNQDDMPFNQSVARVVRQYVPERVRQLVPLPIRRRIALAMDVTHYDIIGDHVTFHEEGFVLAPSPSLLLCRHNHEIAAIGRMIGDRSPGRTLEIGCGFGRLSPVLAGFSEKLTSIDVNPAALDMARRCYPELRFTLAAGNELPFPDDSFDLVVSWTVLQHVPPDQFANVTAEIVRVLAPDGAALLCEATWDEDEPYTRETLTWNRTIDAYASALAPLRLARHGQIESLDRIEGLGSPGRVMLFTTDVE